MALSDAVAACGDGSVYPALDAPATAERVLMAVQRGSAAMFDLGALRAAVAAQGRVARVVIAAVEGSAPREVGAAMLVWADGSDGTIGGGALECEAMARARGLLANGRADAVRPRATGAGVGAVLRRGGGIADRGL